MFCRPDMCVCVTEVIMRTDREELNLRLQFVEYQHPKANEHLSSLTSRVCSVENRTGNTISKSNLRRICNSVVICK